MTKMPALFVGHGSPMNAIEENAFSREWSRIGKSIPPPQIILCISAHWETRGSLITAMDHPRTIHDFGGFPPELYAATYPAPGDRRRAMTIAASIAGAHVGLDESWGLDHGCWIVLTRMFPHAKVPVIQLSLDHTQPASFHYRLGHELAPLREHGVLIIGSGNLVHNLPLVAVRSTDFNEPFGFDWAIEANEILKKLIVSNQHQQLCAYETLGESVQLAVPTPEHYLPMLYALALKADGERLTFFNDAAVAGSLTMTSFVISPK
jgi:4,5-DOPA dioxygenase extradiol